MSRVQGKELRVKVGQRLRSVRQSHGLTQDDVARKIGIAVESYGRLERGASFPSIPTLIALAQVLDCPVDGLLDVSAPAPELAQRPEVQRLLHLVEGMDDKTLKQINRTVEMITKGGVE